MSHASAIAQLKRTIELDPYFATTHGHLGAVYDAKGMYSESLSELLEAKRLGDAPWIDVHLGIAHAHLGHIGEARRILRALERRHLEHAETACVLAMIHAALGEKEEALAELQRGYREHIPAMVWLKADPIASPLRDDPRFQAILHNIGFPP